MHLDLTKTAWQQPHGDLMAYGSWMEIEGRTQPVLVIVRKGDEQSDYFWPCVVPMNNMWVWSEEKGDEVIAGRTCAQFLEVLRLSCTNQNALRILSIVRDHIGDVFSQPPLPPGDEKIVADARITDLNSGEIIETEIKARV